MRPASLLFLLLAPPGITAAATPQAPDRCAPDAGWNDPAKPRRIHGTTYYVDTCGISALLIAGDHGHVLVDAGTAQAAPMVEASIRALGFRVEDIRAIVGSHAHADHAGGLARLQRDARARVYARAPALTALRDGKPTPDDPQWKGSDGFPPVANLHEVRDGGRIRVGRIALAAHAAPGHTPGGTSWTWRSCERGRCVDIAFVDSLTPVSDEGFRFSDAKAHPGLADAFRASIAHVASMPCDILVTAHPAVSRLWSRLGPGAKQPLVDPGACRALAQSATQALDERLAKEASAP